MTHPTLNLTAVLDVQEKPGRYVLALWRTEDGREVYELVYANSARREIPPIPDDWAFSWMRSEDPSILGVREACFCVYFERQGDE